MFFYCISDYSQVLEFNAFIIQSSRFHFSFAELIQPSKIQEKENILYFLIRFEIEKLWLLEIEYSKEFHL